MHFLLKSCSSSQKTVSNGESYLVKQSLFFLFISKRIKTLDKTNEKMYLGFCEVYE